MSASKIRARFYGDQIVLPPWPIYWWIFMVLGALMACAAILPLVSSVVIFTALLGNGGHLFSVLALAPLVALSLCLVYDLFRGQCVLMNWHGGTFLLGMAEFLISDDMLNVLVLGRARDVLRRVKADGRWMLQFERRWPFGWTQLKFTSPLDRIGPVVLHVSIDRATNEPERLPTSRVRFGQRTPQFLELFPADATAVAETLKQWEQEALSSG